MAMQFRVAVEIEGSSPEIFKIGFVFSDVILWGRSPAGPFS
jgi:hypothetical protein